MNQTDLENRFKAARVTMENSRARAERATKIATQAKRKSRRAKVRLKRAKKESKRNRKEAKRTAKEASAFTGLYEEARKLFLKARKKLAKAKRENSAVWAGAALKIRRIVAKKRKPTSASSRRVPSPRRRPSMTRETGKKIESSLPLSGSQTPSAPIPSVASSATSLSMATG